MNYQTEIEAAMRRGKRIFAMQRGQKIPFPESAEQDARPGNSDDEVVLALVRGQAAIPGAAIFPPAKILSDKQKALRREFANGTDVLAANEVEILAVGPTVAWHV